MEGKGLGGSFSNIYACGNSVIFRTFFRIGRLACLHYTSQCALFFHSGNLSLLLQIHRAYIFHYGRDLGMDEYNKLPFSFSIVSRKNEALDLFKIQGFFIFHNNKNIQAWAQNREICIECIAS